MAAHQLAVALHGFGLVALRHLHLSYALPEQHRSQDIDCCIAIEHVSNAVGLCAFKAFNSIMACRNDNVGCLQARTMPAAPAGPVPPPSGRPPRPARSCRRRTTPCRPACAAVAVLIVAGAVAGGQLEHEARSTARQLLRRDLEAGEGPPAGMKKEAGACRPTLRQQNASGTRGIGQTTDATKTSAAYFSESTHTSALYCSSSFSAIEAACWLIETDSSKWLDSSDCKAR